MGARRRHRYVAVSADADQPDSETGAWPPGKAAGGRAPPNLSLAVGRGHGSVVVTVDGELAVSGCELLQGVLTDLIAGQGNLTVVVDLGKAVVERDALMVFVDAARQARRHGTKFLLKGAPPETDEAMRSGGFDDMVEVLPRQSSGG